MRFLLHSQGDRPIVRVRAAYQERQNRSVVTPWYPEKAGNRDGCFRVSSCHSLGLTWPTRDDAFVLPEILLINSDTPLGWFKAEGR